VIIFISHFGHRGRGFLCRDAFRSVISRIASVILSLVRGSEGLFKNRRWRAMALSISIQLSHIGSMLWSSREHNADSVRIVTKAGDDGNKENAYVRSPDSISWLAALFPKYRQEHCGSAIAVWPGNSAMAKT
jgi:hypothetical protein